MRKLIKRILGRSSDTDAPSPSSASGRAPRVRLLPLEKISFKREGGPSDEVLNLIDISESGAGLRVKNKLGFPAVGENLAGHLTIQDQSIPVTAKVIHYTGHTLGISFTSPLEKISSAVRAYFQMEVTAGKAVRVPTEKLKQPERGTSHCFQTPNQCELYLVEDEGVILHFHLALFGNYFEADLGGPLKVGKIIEDGKKSSLETPSKIRFSTGVSPELIPTAIRFLESISELSPAHAQILRTAIQSGRLVS